jgi:valyl-tRNA synthetase
MPRELPKSYDPTAIEDKWAATWVRERLFETPTPAHAGQKPFVMLLPPPNVTGRLHMGHMLNQTEMDILTRWHRMRGDLAVWVPGTDHAGIATQMMVERKLTEEGQSRQQLGREAFVERVWEWKKEYGGAILDQMKRLGASVDWSREYFTMDERLSVAVKEAFVRLHEQGLIYRGAYIVNWCPRCQTAISDVEVVHEEQLGKLYEIRYPVVGEDGQFLAIATTRPETMLGDVAVVVNPTDDRYMHLHGKKLRLPLTSREIPVLPDDWANPEFGTGAVKVTPAHDPNDFAIAERHKLTPIVVMDETAHMNQAAGEYAGLDRYAARKKIVADLDALGLLVAVKDHGMSVGKCDRCKTVVEPRLSTQWFVKIQPLADKAIEAVESGAIRFTPEQYKKTYFEWMRNIHDWCISRQLWWGHRIPAWHCSNCSGITVVRDTPDLCAHCGRPTLTQETDVLDTWFSSGLLPFTVFGWPEQTPDLAAFYPTQLLVTGFDILFFWVARMIMLGCHFMLDVPMSDGSKRSLADAVPFREVYIHALVRDADRQKMSKTKGNVVDPIDVIQRFGTDAVRFTLASMASPGTDIAFSEARTEGYRAFANKIWNAARFIFMQMERAKEAGIEVDVRSMPKEIIIAENASLEMKWILSRLSTTALDVNRALAGYRFDDAASHIYRFFWGDFCDWYLEGVKLYLDFSGTEDSPQRATAIAALTMLVSLFEAALRLLSPFMPFLTEEIWHALYDGNPPHDSIALATYPDIGLHAVDMNAEGTMSTLHSFVMTIRSLRKEYKVPEKQLVSIAFHSNDQLAETFQQETEWIKRRAKLKAMERTVTLPSGTNSRGNVNFSIEILDVGQIDPAALRERLQKELIMYQRAAQSSTNQLDNSSFVSKAPPQVVELMRQHKEEMTVLIEKTRAALDELDAVGSR